MAAVDRVRDRRITGSELETALHVAGDDVLIGGQAVAFWLAWFGLPLPAGPRAYISRDADFLGLRESVSRFAHALGARPEFPGDRQLSALHGSVVTHHSGQPQVLVDVLRSVVGIRSDVIRSNAIRVTLPDPPYRSFLVMSPGDCLVSRLENLRKLADKRNEIGVWQARIASEVCGAHIVYLLASGNERAARRVATKVLQLAGQPAGLQAYARYGIDIVDAIPLANFETREFRDQQYPRMVQKIRTLRGLAATRVA